MTILAAEGGYQSFHLGGGEFLILALCVGSALAALAVGFSLMKGVLAQDKGTETMQAIATSIQEGALAYLKRQFRTVGVILVPLAAIVFVTSTKIVKPDGDVALSFFQSGLFRTLAFVAGGFLSGLTGFIGMTLATQGNVRTAAAAKRNSLPDALKVAFRTGGVAGMFTVGLGLLGATIIILFFQNTSSAILVGFGFGGSLLALFLRVGGGIFTKAADVGADLVGKVEAGIPEDDPPQPGHHRRQRGRQRGRLRRHGGRPVRELRGHPGGLHHPRRVRLRGGGRQPGSRPGVPAGRPGRGRGRLHRRRLRRQGQAG
jgi:K(+)-stimulated pyrophosphate-energized sodium pump